MSQTEKKTVTLLTGITALLTVILTVLRVLISARYLDSGIEQFRSGALAVTVFHVLLTVSAVAVLLMGFWAHGKKQIAIAYGNPGIGESYLAYLSGFMILAYVLSRIYSMIQTDFTDMYPLFGAKPALMYSTPPMVAPVFLLLMLITAIPASVYFLVVARAETAVKRAARPLSLFPLIWSILYVLHTYFDMTLAYNSPVKILRLCGAAAVMLAMIAESRSVVGIPQPGLLLSMGLLGGMLGTVAMCGDMILYLMGYVSLAEGTFAPASMLCVSLFLFARMFGIRREPKILSAPTEDDGEESEESVGGEVSENPSEASSEEPSEP